MTPGLYHYNASHEEVTVTADDIRNGIVRVKRRGLRVAHYTEQQFEKYYTAGKPRTNEQIFNGE